MGCEFLDSVFKKYGGKFSILKLFPENNRENAKVFSTTKLNKKLMHRI
jgi:hypothetical protein